MKFLIILLFPISVFAQDYYNCVEYTIKVGNNSNVASDSSCYVSTFQKTRKRHTLTVCTSEYVARFAVLRSIPINVKEDNTMGRGLYNGTLTLAVIVGETDQLYAIQEVIRPDRYFFSVSPIQQSERKPKVISGRVLAISNRKICQ